MKIELNEVARILAVNGFGANEVQRALRSTMENEASKIAQRAYENAMRRAEGEIDRAMIDLTTR